MRTIKFDLNEQAEKLLSDLVKSPAYFGDTPRTLFIKLMMQAGQASHSASKSASNEPETPHTGKVELRQQAEREASLASRRAGLEAQVEQARRGDGSWPKLDQYDGELDEEGRERYCFPDGKVGYWTPPEDYPKSLIAANVHIRNRNSERVKAINDEPADTDPPPIPEDYDNLDEYEFARTAWYRRSFPALEEE